MMSRFWMVEVDTWLRAWVLKSMSCFPFLQLGAQRRPVQQGLRMGASSMLELPTMEVATFQPPQLHLLSPERRLKG